MKVILIIAETLGVLFIVAFVIALVEVFWLEPRKQKREELRREAMKGMKQIYP